MVLDLSLSTHEISSDIIDRVPPPVTKETHNFAQLETIDLSKFDSDDPKVQDELVADVKRAIREDGFLFLENYGVTIEQVSQFNPFTT